ncbi:adenylate/guanylate cyclase domain-containing protein, partial [Methylobacterium soli]|uniref:adenylate/guanylate cyclase domain-containing protein n=1 Tax=Methylobacterium soli TaxID=553447 RepID=UPI001EE39C68
MNRIATERHLAAILIADIVGYSRLMGVNEEGTLRRLKALRSGLIHQTVRQHEGRIVKWTGDEVLVEFPSAVSAVRCALDVQRSMIDRNAALPEPERICFRIGINVGELMAEKDGDVFGDSVNLAKRLETLSPCGGLCFSRAVRDQVRDRITLPFEDWGERSLKNIARPVRVFAVTPEVIASLPAANDPVQVRRAHLPITVTLFAVSATSLLVAGLWFALRSATHPVSPSLPVTAPEQNASAPIALPGPTAPRLSIVVLPFVNLSDEPGQDYIAESITADLTTDLSRIRESFVIASGTALSYKGRTTDLRQAGRDLGVRYVLTGSVRRAGERIRVNAQLADATSGVQIWSDRFEGDRSTFPDLQDELIARRLSASVSSRSSVRARRAMSSS